MDSTSDTNSTPKGFRARSIIAILSFFAIYSVHYVRVYVNISIPYYAEIPKCDEHLYVNYPCGYIPSFNHLKNATHKQKSLEKLTWTSVDQSLVLGAFYYGYAIVPYPSYWILDKGFVSAKWMIGIGVLSTASLGFLLPLCKVENFWYMFAVRLLQGFAAGVVSPSMNALLEKWFPDFERKFVQKFIFTGIPAGISTAFFVSGNSVVVELEKEWVNIYTIHGVGVIMWFILWAVLVYETPKTHRFLSEEKANRIDEAVKRDFKELGPVPWKKMVSSREVWVLTTTHFLQDCNHHVMLISLPTYLNHVVNLNFISISNLLCVAFLMNAFAAGLSILMSDKLRTDTKLSITQTRKILNTLATFVPAIFLFILSLAMCRPLAVACFITLSIFASGLKYSGYYLVYSDMCPDYADILLMICGCFTNTTGLLVPLFVGLTTYNEHRRLNWGFIFLTSATVLIASGALFVVYGTAEEQPWGRSRREEDLTWSKSEVDDVTTDEPSDSDTKTK